MVDDLLENRKLDEHLQGNSNDIRIEDPEIETKNLERDFAFVAFINPMNLAGKIIHTNIGLVKTKVNIGLEQIVYAYISIYRGKL